MGSSSVESSVSDVTGSTEQLYKIDIGPTEIGHGRRCPSSAELCIGQKLLPKCTELLIGVSDEQTMLPSQQLLGEARVERVTGLIG